MRQYTFPDCEILGQSGQWIFFKAGTYYVSPQTMQNRQTGAQTVFGYDVSLPNVSQQSVDPISFETLVKNNIIY